MSNLIFQYPLLASTIEKYWAPFSVGSISSIVGVRVRVIGLRCLMVLFGNFAFCIEIV